MKALLLGDRKGCRQIVFELLDDNIEIKSLYLGLFQRSLYEVGELWQKRRISVAVEHLASAITEFLIAETYSQVFSREPVDKSVVVSSIANEYHQIGALMVANYFELHGWESSFLGANTPTSDLLDLIDKRKPDIVALSLSVFFGMSNLLQIIKSIRENNPGQRIIVGGQAFVHMEKDPLESFKHTEIVLSLSALDALILK